jgi:hypothetical protein
MYAFRVASRSAIGPWQGRSVRSARTAASSLARPRVCGSRGSSRHRSGRCRAAGARYDWGYSGLRSAIVSRVAPVKAKRTCGQMLAAACGRRQVDWPSRARGYKQMTVDARSAWVGEPKPPEVHGGVRRRDELRAAVRVIIARSARRTPPSAPGSASDRADTARRLGRLTGEFAGRRVAPSGPRSHDGRGAG